MDCEQTDILLYTYIYRYPISPTPQPSPALPFCPPQPHVDLLLDLEKYCGKFGDASYYRDGMHSEQTNKQTDILLYIYRCQIVEVTNNSICCSISFFPSVSHRSAFQISVVLAAQIQQRRYVPRLFRSFVSRQCSHLSLAIYLYSRFH